MKPTLQAVHPEPPDRVLSGCLHVLAQLLARLGATLEEILEQHSRDQTVGTQYISPRLACDDGSDSFEGCREQHIHTRCLHQRPDAPKKRHMGKAHKNCIIGQKFCLHHITGTAFIIRLKLYAYNIVENSETFQKIYSFMHLK